MLLTGVFLVGCSFANHFGRYPSLAAPCIIREDVKKELTNGKYVSEVHLRNVSCAPVQGAETRNDYDDCEQNSTCCTKNGFAKIKADGIRM